MNIVTAQMEQLQTVKYITHQTIGEIYPRYYAPGAVDFFVKHHNDENIAEDILSNRVFLLAEEEEIVGTVTVRQREICRLFVLPRHQGKGYGTALLDFAEAKIAERYNEAIVDVSLPAKEIYKKRGYEEFKYNTITTDNGDMLCYDVMKKKCKDEPKVSYDNKVFVPKANSENGEVDFRTTFKYHQKGNMVWAEYAGGEILNGFLIGTADNEGILDFTYLHLNQKGDMRMGKCHSVPAFLIDGKIELHEEWQWLNGDKSRGSSIVSEQ